VGWRAHKNSQLGVRSFTHSPRPLLHLQYRLSLILSWELRQPHHTYTQLHTRRHTVGGYDDLNDSNVGFECPGQEDLQPHGLQQSL